MEMMYGGGLRVSELVALNFGAINFEDGTVRVLGKGEKERVCPLGKVAMSVLEHWQTNFAPNSDRSAAVFVDEDHRHHAPQTPS